MIVNLKFSNLSRQLGRFSRAVILTGFVVMAVGLVLVLSNKPVHAQTYIEPGNPLGGVTAAPLNSSSSVQRKAGSLIIGSAGGPISSLCLNSDTVNNNYNQCISSWGQLGSLTGNYVIVNQDTWVGGNPGVAAQSGYVRIKPIPDPGSGPPVNQLYTVIAEANSINNSAAVYAWDSGNANAWAGYFNGRVYIGDGTGTSTKKLCLNGTADLSGATAGKGCITTWTGVSNQLSGQYVLLQASPGPFNVQVGGESLTGAGVFGTDPAKNGGVVLGVPGINANICYTCGDGICSPGETNVNCPFGAQVPSCTNVPYPLSVPPGPGGDCS